MADVVKGSVGLALGAALVVVGVAIGLSVLEPGEPGPRPVLAAPGDGRETTGAPLRLSALDGPAPTLALGVIAGEDDADSRMMVLKVPVEGLRGAAQVHGYNTGQHAIAHPLEPGVALLSYSSRSTHLGCTVGMLEEALFLTEAYGVSGPLLIDPCSQSQWDAYDLASLRPHQPADGPLDVLRIALVPQGDDPRFLVVQRIHQDTNGDGDLQGPDAPFSLGGAGTLASLFLG